MLCSDCYYAKRKSKGYTLYWCRLARRPIVLADFGCEKGISKESIGKKQRIPPVHRRRSAHIEKKHEQFKVMYPFFPNKCMAEMFGFSCGYIEQLAKQYQLKKSKPEKYKKMNNQNRLKKPEITKAKLMECRENGMNIVESCKYLRITYTTYYKRMREENKVQK